MKNGIPQKLTLIRLFNLQNGLIALALILLLSLPLWLPLIPLLGTEILSLRVINSMGIYIIAVLGLQIMMGYCGQLSLGHAAFMAVGGYASAIFTSRFGFPFWVALPLAGLMAGLVGVIFGASAIRLKGFHLIAATLGAQFIVLWYIGWAYPITKGYDGLPVPLPNVLYFSFNTDGRYFYIILACVFIGTFFIRNLIKTKVGRAFIAVRDNELAASVMGIRVLKTKLLAFFIGCAYAGVAGSLWVHWAGIAFPSLFSFHLSVWLLGYLIIGGMATTIGPFLGVISIVLLNNGLSSTVRALGSADFALTAGDFVYGIILAIFLIFEPYGLARRWSLIKKRFMSHNLQTKIT